MSEPVHPIDSQLDACRMVASESASSCGPQPNDQPPPPTAHEPNPTRVICNPLRPSGRVGSAIVTLLASEPASGWVDIACPFIIQTTCRRPASGRRRLALRLSARTRQRPRQVRVPADLPRPQSACEMSTSNREEAGANTRRRSSMRRAVMGSMVVGALVSLLVSLARAQARDLDATLTIWPTRGGTSR